MDPGLAKLKMEKIRARFRNYYQMFRPDNGCLPFCTYPGKRREESKGPFAKKQRKDSLLDADQSAVVSSKGTWKCRKEEQELCSLPSVVPPLYYWSSVQLRTKGN